MIWQEWVFLAGSLLQLPSLMPTLIGPHKPPVTTSLPIAAILYAFAATFVTLDQLVSAAAMCATATVWAAIAVQRMARPKVRVRLGWPARGILVGSIFVGVVKMEVDH